jgi:hypothetical protein
MPATHLQPPLRHLKWPLSWHPAWLIICIASLGDPNQASPFQLDELEVNYQHLIPNLEQPSGLNYTESQIFFRDLLIFDQFWPAIF